MRCLGLIPTHAGKTGRACPPRWRCRAHPHSRGENCGSRARASRARGSSPLTRGKRRGSAGGRHPLGLIPTHAGKTRSFVRTNSTTGAHPHSRGENAGGALKEIPADGSSPLTRGKRRVSHFCCLSVGLIPTHAGKTCSSGGSSRRRRAHPHSRGENAEGVERVRYVLGLIPTHAGKTQLTTKVLSRVWAHPHSRGENSCYLGVRVKKEGSSPLTRGKPVYQTLIGRVSGLIPTHAGKTRARGQSGR